MLVVGSNMARSAWSRKLILIFDYGDQLQRVGVSDDTHQTFEG